MRQKNVLDMLISQARRKLDELKQLQFFGGDALNLKRATFNITIPSDQRAHCWRVTMTPINTDTTMPISAIVKPSTTNQFRSFGLIERVKRSDGVFEFLIMYSENYNTEPWQDMFVVTFSGKADFSITQLA